MMSMPISAARATSSLRHHVGTASASAAKMRPPTPVPLLPLRRRYHLYDRHHHQQQQQHQQQLRRSYSTDTTDTDATRAANSSSSKETTAPQQRPGAPAAAAVVMEEGSTADQKKEQPQQIGHHSSSQQQQQQQQQEWQGGILKSRSLGQFFKHLWSIRLFTFLVLSALMIMFAMFRKWTLDSRVVSHFYRPSADELEVYKKNMVERPELEQQLNVLFHIEGNYGLVWGENGMGKTSTVVKLIHEKLRPAEGVPVFYISASEKEFKKELSTALGFDAFSEFPESVVQLLTLTYPEPSTEFLLDTLKRAARIMKKKSGHRPVLVIDACNDLEATPEGSDFLRAIQNWAKKQADANGMNVVFVSSEGKAPRTLLGRGVSSRMSDVRVSEASDEEARRFLELKRDVHDSEEQNRILAITGGAFKYLKRANLGIVTREIANNLSHENFKLGESAFYSVTQTILEKGSIPYDDFLSAFEGGDIKAKKLLEGNVYLWNSEKGIVTFQNRATRNFVAELFAAEQKKREEKEQKRREEEKQKRREEEQKKREEKEQKRREEEEQKKSFWQRWFY